MLSNNNQTFKVLKFESNKIQAYFQDGSIIGWHHNSILYISPKAIRTNLNLSHIASSSDLKMKFAKIISILNIYNETYIDELDDCEDNVIKKKYLIKQFQWQGSSAYQDKEGHFCIKSIDDNAKVILKSNLYTFQVTYLQLCSNKSSINHTKTNHSLTKQLLEKYNYNYTKFPEQNIEIQYNYHQVTKYYFLFNLPYGWLFPAIQIWNYILSNQIIKHNFLHAELNSSSTVRTRMPKLFKISESKEVQQNLSMPIYGKPNSHYKCQWMYIENAKIFACFYQDGCLLCEENLGFWNVQNFEIIYRKYNKDQFEYKYHCNAIPLVIRFKFEPQRNIKIHLNAFVSYYNHNRYLENNNIEQSKSMNQFINENNKNNSEEIIFQNYAENVGIFKAYANGMVVVKFQDRTFLTLKNFEVNIISPQGEKYCLGIAMIKSPIYDQFKDHLQWANNFYEEIFHEQEWKEKQKIINGLSSVLKANQGFLKVCQRF